MLGAPSPSRRTLRGRLLASASRSREASVMSSFTRNGRVAAAAAGVTALALALSSQANTQVGNPPPPPSSSTSPKLDIPFTKYQLDNGLTVILHEDHALPLVAVNIMYKVGSRFEQEHRTGFAHLFEHLM